MGPARGIATVAKDTDTTMNTVMPMVVGVVEVVDWVAVAARGLGLGKVVEAAGSNPRGQIPRQHIDRSSWKGVISLLFQECGGRGAGSLLPEHSGGESVVVGQFFWRIPTPVCGSPIRLLPFFVSRNPRGVTRTGP